MAVTKLIEAYNLAQEELPYDIALEFESRVIALKAEVTAAEKGQFSVLKQKIRTTEAELEKAIQKQLALVKERKKQEELEQAARDRGQKPANRILHQPKIKTGEKKEKSPFEKAVSLYDPEKVRLRPAEEVIAELQGQADLLDLIIETEMNNSMEIRYYNVRREVQGLVLQIGFSEASEWIEAGTGIILEHKGNFYDLKCAKILNSGSKLLLLPVNETGKFEEDFPLDLTNAKFFYVPNIQSEDVQKNALKQIVQNLAQEDKSTGLKVLDYFLRIKAAVSDIKSLDELKQDLPYTAGLDQFQKAAVNMIVKSKFGLILGPFGTGKTRVILAGAKNIILKNKKPVFIVAPQHKIADDITLKAGKCGIPVLRCGNKTDKFDPEVKKLYARQSETGQIEFIRRFKELNKGDDQNGCLFVGTDLGASFDWLLSQLRDPESAMFLKDVTLIVDEAALINYPELITAVYMLKPDALILVGDHVQFSPYKLAAKFSRKVMNIFSEKIPHKTIRRYHISSFKELISMPFNKVKLAINYRNPWLSVDLLKNWYRNIVDIQSYSKQKNDIPDQDTFVIKDTSGLENQFREEYYPGTFSFCNKTEALWIIKRIRYFLDKGYKADDIATITFYDGQIRLIRDFIDANTDNETGIAEADAEVLKRNIFTPIRFQGAEKKVILASLVRSKKPDDFEYDNQNGNNKMNSLFISEPEYAKSEALLVLLSRHKGKLSVIGNHETLENLTGDRYKHLSYLYYSLFSYKEKVDAVLEAQKVKMKKAEKEFSDETGLIDSAI